MWGYFWQMIIEITLVIDKSTILIVENLQVLKKL